jgi:hypothetical protein
MLVSAVLLQWACGASQAQQTQVADESDQKGDAIRDDLRRCKLASGLTNAGAAIAGQQALPDDCVQSAALEYGERDRQDDIRRTTEAKRTELEEHQRAEDSRQFRARQDRDRQVRMAPKSPEIGATLQESRVLCEQQTGNQIVQRSAIGSHATCRVGNAPIYVALVRKDEQGISSLTVYYEQGDIAAQRKSTEDKFGPPSDSGVSEGFRYWTWYADKAIISVSGYSAGVSLSFEGRR